MSDRDGNIERLGEKDRERATLIMMGEDTARDNLKRSATPVPQGSGAVGNEGKVYKFKNVV